MTPPPGPPNERPSIQIRARLWRPRVHAPLREAAIDPAPPPSAPPARICLSPGSVDGGGIGIVMLTLAEEFLARGIAVDLLVSAPARPARPLPPGLNVIVIGRRARRSLPRAVAYLRRARPEAIIAARGYINLMMLAAHRLSGLRRSCRLIWTFHTHRSMQMSRSRGVDRLADGLVLRLLARADARVAVSQGVAEDLRRAAGGRAPPVAVIENPAWSAARAALAQAPCPHPWLAARPARGAAGLAAGFPTAAPPDPVADDSGAGGAGGAAGDGPVILAAGRLTAQKDFPTLLRALALARDVRPGLRLLLLGEGPERPALEALRDELGLGGAVEMPGHAANPLAHFARGDLFVLSSLWEGFALVLVEALGAGIRVVSTDCPAGPAEVLEGGRLGRLVPPGDAAALAAAMLATLAAPHDPAPGRARAEDFSAARAAEAYLALPAKAPGGKGRNGPA